MTNQHAQALGKKRWKGVSKEDRIAHGKKYGALGAKGRTRDAKGRMLPKTLTKE